MMRMLANEMAMSRVPLGVQMHPGMHPGMGRSGLDGASYAAGMMGGAAAMAQPLAARMGDAAVLLASINTRCVGCAKVPPLQTLVLPMLMLALLTRATQS